MCLVLLQFHLTPLMTGLVFVINGGVYALTAPGWGWLCDRVQQTKYITLVGAICITVRIFILFLYNEYSTYSLFSFHISRLVTF